MSEAVQKARSRGRQRFVLHGKAPRLAVVLLDSIHDHQNTIECEFSPGNSERDWQESMEFSEFYKALEPYGDWE